MIQTRTQLIAAACIALAVATPGCNRLARKSRAAKPAFPATVKRAEPTPEPEKLDPVTESQQAVDRARLLQDQSLDEVALAEYARAILINPRSAPAYLGIGEIQKKRGNVSEAQSSFAKAADLEPQSFSAQYNNGLCLQQLGRFAEAIRAYIRALAINADDFDANLNLATAYLQQGEPAAGLIYAKRAVKLKGNSGAARFNLGAIYAAVDDHENAIVEYQQAAELMELSPKLLLNLGESLGRVGRYAEMQNTLEQLIRVEPSAAAYERLATAHFRQTRFDEALTNFRKSVEIDQRYYQAWNGIGVCLLNRWLMSDKADTEAKDEGFSALRKSLQIDRQQPTVIDLINRYGG